MKIFALIAFLILVVLGCDSEKEFEKHVPNPDAVKLYKEAWKIAMYENEYNEKVDSAIFTLEKAIKIDSLYIEPHLGIIGFATLNKDKTQAFEYCHRAQRIYVNFPEFFMLEGVIRESNNETKTARKFYKKALDIYENDLMDEMEENPDLELHYVECLYLNNQKKKANKKLEELKANNKQDDFFNGLTMEILMEGYHVLKKR
jgi:tetratricopeptide (TPR) repeat protein